MQQYAWYAINEATDDDGFYLEDSPELHEAERAALKEEGAPDTDTIEFVSILPEDRDEALVEARITDALRDWLEAEGLLVE